jgi:pimeloyl-ACP methyl ester carboxylesterase
MTRYISGESNAGDQFVRLDDGDMHVVLDGKPGAPALLLIHGFGASTAWWDRVVPRLADAYRVIRVDLLGHGRSASPARGYDIPTQAGRVGRALDRLGVNQVTAIGHSTGGAMVTSLAEQRPDLVAALALIDIGPDTDARIPQGLASRLLLAPLTGRLLWRLKTQATVRKAASSAFTRPIDIPDVLVADAMGMTYRAIAGTGRAVLDYLGQRSLTTRLSALGLPVLVIFGAEDHRWRSSSAAAYRAVARVEVLPGIGHTPMMEDCETTGTLLLEFVGTVGHSGWNLDARNEEGTSERQVRGRPGGQRRRSRPHLCR